ncbi:vanillate O-demethylase monooxygenase subunit [Pseudomonas duriflava]|uniref:Vanillate O-demethylase monooxygenase subunit n=1 Tax=Pseudomonas duriflava TaxID=459528 RepID=A0A562Q2Q5_9PSED|nr:aromatic ring-hydroxylating dioxygenase subunit alpha [Pseudomonas duriflava]TWI50918.1 vanillate O-demethylase monooxygenase subunit [Pseudomonas duriflava]
MFVKNCWYVAGWSHEIPKDGFLARTIVNVPLLFWRDNDDNVVVLEDRCCHRGAPLSMGRKEGECIRCMYHGLLFDKNGQCVGAPAQERIPPQAKVRTYPIVERHRWLWVWMGDPTLADESLIWDTQWLDHPEWRCEPGYLHYDCNYLLIADNLLDFSHLPFVHPTTLGGSPDYAEVKPKVERLEHGVRMTKWVYNTEAPAYSRKFGNYPPDAKVDRWMYYDFMIPGVLLMDTGMTPAGQGAANNMENSIKFRACQAITPETENSTHYFFAQAHDFLIDQPEVTHSIYQSVITAFEEDKNMIMAQQKNLARDSEFKMVPFSIDAALGQFRWLINRMIQKEQSADDQQPAAEAARKLVSGLR